MNVSVIIPAYNEEGAIGKVVQSLPLDLVKEIIVVDNGSTDQTAERARAAGAIVVRESLRGYGAACRAGLESTRKTDAVVFLDGDNSDDPADLPSLLAPLRSGTADFVLGSRLSGPGSIEAMPLHARLGNRFVAGFISRAYNLNITDIGSFKAIKRELLLSLGMSEMTCGWPVEMLVKAAKRGARIHEVPVNYRKRIGRSKISGTIKGSAIAAYYMLWLPLRYAFKE